MSDNNNNKNDKSEAIITIIASVTTLGLSSTLTNQTSGPSVHDTSTITHESSTAEPYASMGTTFAGSVVGGGIGTVLYGPYLTGGTAGAGLGASSELSEDDKADYNRVESLADRALRKYSNNDDKQDEVIFLAQSEDIYEELSELFEGKSKEEVLVMLNGILNACKEVEDEKGRSRKR